MIETILSKHTIGTEIDFQAGCMILVDKPLEWTSFDAVNKLRYQVSRKVGVKRVKVGHAGTLDPLATGLLLICTGKYTKKLADLQVKDKSYSCVVRLGATTASYDAEHPEENIMDPSMIDLSRLDQVIDKFVGNINQMPPMFSALKKDGKKLYKLARKGIEVERPARPIVIHHIKKEKLEGQDLYLDVLCGKGTYIRSLAHDIGQELGCGGYLKALRRTTIDTFNVEDALSIEEIVNYLAAF